MIDNPNWSLRNSAFANALLDPDTEIPVGVGRGSEAAPKRFSVYRNNVVVSLLEALEGIFPSLKALLGDDQFALVTRAYVANSPPRSPLIQTYGENFADFLATLPPLRDLPFLGDVARVERHWLNAFHAADAPNLTPDDLAGFTPDQSMELIFKTHPATCLFISQHPVYDLFQARKNWPNDAINFEETQSVLITRVDYSPVIERLHLDQLHFFNQLLQGVRLALAIGKTTEKYPAFSPADAIALALDSGMFTEVTVADRTGEKGS